MNAVHIECERRHASHRALAAAIAALVAAFATPARAQHARPMVPLAIESDTAHTRFEVQRGGDLAPLAKCDGACSMLLPQGEYRLVVHGSDGVASGKRIFELYAPTRYRLSPDAPAQRWAGLSLAVTGTLAVIAGYALLLLHSCSEQCSTPFEGSRTVGAGLLLGGLVVSIPGWVIFQKSFRPGLEAVQTAPPGG